MLRLIDFLVAFPMTHVLWKVARKMAPATPLKNVKPKEGKIWGLVPKDSECAAHVNSIQNPD